MTNKFDEILLSSKKEDWETPKNLFDYFNKIYNFTLDPCSTKENAKCKKFYTKNDNGLSKEWSGSVFVNPPYCRKTKLWVEKAFNEKENCDYIVMLLPCRPDVSYFHDFILNKSRIIFLRGRLKFGNSKNTAPFPSMIVIYGDGIGFESLWVKNINLK